jgi:hypothetical protein
MSGDDQAYEVVKWYTRARRFPQLIGKTPDGARIWGGPYTYTQLVGAVTVLVVGAKTVGLWGRFGLVGNALILLAVAYATALILGRLPVGSRNPIAVAAGVFHAVTCPPGGRLAGSPVRIRRPHRAATRAVITPSAPAASPTPPPPQPQKVSASPAADPPRPAPALTGVQRLLAASATSAGRC